MKPILRLIPHVAAALAIAAALACGERAGNGGDLPVLRERGSIRLLAPRLAAEDDLYDHGELLRRERVLADAFVQLQGLQPDWVLLDRYEDLLPALLDGRGDIVVAGLTATPERQERVAFSAPLAFVQERVVTRAGTPAVTTLDDLAGRTIAVRRSSSFWETLADVGADYPDIEVVEAPEDLDTEEILYRVSTGEYDATVADDIRIGSAQTYLDNLSEGIALTEDRAIAWAIRPDSPELLSAIDSFVREFNPESRHPERYLGDLPEIKQRKILRVLTRNSSSTYFVWRGQIMGFEYDLAREFAKQHGLQVVFVVAPTRAGLLTWLRQGHGDVVAAGLTRTAARESFGHGFSRPYNYVSEVLVARSADSTLRAPSDLAGRTIAVRRSSSYWTTAEELQASSVDVSLVAAPEALETEDIIDAVARGDYDLTIADSHILNVELTWRDDVIGAFTLRDSVAHAWAVREGDDELKAAIDQFFNREYRGLFYNVTRKKYFGSPSRTQRFATARSTRSGTISPYDELFRRHSQQYDFDWRLVAAQSYEESQFDPNVVSFAGAVGLMQVLPRTGGQFGFENLTDPDEGVHAGVFYMRHLYDRLDYVPEAEDRLWFALAAYNAGLGHVTDARRLAAELGEDPDTWTGGLEDVLPLLRKPEYYRRAKHGYCRCLMPIHYVRKIRDRYDAYAEAVPREAVAEDLQ